MSKIAVRCSGPTFAYFVHDVTDAAVARRVRMFEAGGAEVTVLGFRRRGPVRQQIGIAPVVDLGVTGDNKLVRRIASILAVLLRPGKVRAALRGCDVIVARNLETLVIARALGGGRRIVYECLDVHRLLVGSSLASWLLRVIERWALRGVALLMVSSPRFLTDHFNVHYADIPNSFLVENRLLDLDDATAVTAARAREPKRPWAIGWFGMLRCARSLEILAALVDRAQGHIKVLIAGIATPAVFPDFAAHVAKVAELEFAGPYATSELGDLYRRVDFAWAIDYFEEGLNSTWLLPNRLYEALAYGTVPIALARTETAAWLTRNGVGLVVADPEIDVANILGRMNNASFAAMVEAVANLPPSLTRAGPDDCQELVRTLAGC